MLNCGFPKRNWKKKKPEYPSRRLHSHGIDLSGSESSPVFNVVFNSAAGSYSASDKDMIMSGREYTLSAGLLLLKILQILMFFVGLSLILAILFLKIKHLAVQGKFIKWRFLLITMGSIIVTAFVVVPSVLKQFREIYIEAQVEQMEKWRPRLLHLPFPSEI